MGVILYGDIEAFECAKHVGRVVVSTINLYVAWWMLKGIKNIYHVNSLPHEIPLTFPKDKVSFGASLLFGA